MSSPINTGWCSMYQDRLQRPSQASAELPEGIGPAIHPGCWRSSHWPQAMPHQSTPS